MEIIKKYEKYLATAKIPLNTISYVILCLAASFLLALATGLILSSLKPLFLNLSDIYLSAKTVLPILVFIVALDISLSYPYLRTISRIEEIETHLPDALKQMANVLKAGGTYELALREASLAEYGALKEELQLSLRKLEEGENFENALKSISQNVDSKLVKRTINIIIDSIKAGAGLASVLEDIAEDAREAKRTHTERKTRTLMQTMFIFATAAFVAPYIFGVVASLIKVFVFSAKGFSTSASIIEESIKAGKCISTMLEFYIFVEILASSAMISLMRENKIQKTLFYFPILLLVAFLIYFAARIITTNMLLGGL